MAGRRSDSDSSPPRSKRRPGRSPSPSRSPPVRTASRSPTKRSRRVEDPPSRGRERERERERDRSSDRTKVSRRHSGDRREHEHERERDIDINRDAYRNRDRDFDRDKSKDRDKDKYKDTDRERVRENYKDNRERDRDRVKDLERERNRERDRDNERGSDIRRDRDRSRESDDDRDKDRNRDLERRRSRHDRSPENDKAHSNSPRKRGSPSPPHRSSSRSEMRAEVSKDQKDTDGETGEDDSLAKMKAAEAELEEKNKVKEVEKPSFEYSGKLAAETNRFRGVTLQFTEPPEARKPNVRWRLYIFKDGEPLDEPLYIHRQSCYLFGRERRVADVPTDHPSCSKQHAVIQYRLVEKELPDGTMKGQVSPYLMDLGSTNGTFLNGNRIEAQRYYELLEKDTVKFGNSSREYVLLHENSV